VASRLLIKFCDVMASEGNKIKKTRPLLAILGYFDASVAVYL
jgi:hypothetical protein